MSTTVTLTSPPEPAILARENASIPLQPLDTKSIGQPATRTYSENLDDLQEQGSPVNAVEVKQKWYKPKSNLAKFILVCFTFLNLGMNDASYGALIPSMGEYYHLGYLVVSLVFMAPFVGYTLAAALSDPIHKKFGQRGIAILSPIFRLIAYIVIAVHPPYPVVVVILGFAGLGIGLADAGWNAWVGNLDNVNELLGFLHGFYGIGATISPLIATAMVTTYVRPWFEFYYVMIGVVVLELFGGIAAFWKETGAAFRASREKTSEGGETKAAIKSRVTWTCAAFLFFYVGTEVSLGGWVVTFMLNVRDGKPFDAGLTATGFWLGITIGRFTLGFVTPRIGEKVAIAAYLLIGAALELIFWLVPNFVVSAVAVSLLGYFLGPLFPASIVATTKLLPSRLHVSAVGISAAIGGGGAAVLPFAVGAIAQAAGVKTLQPIILAFLGIQLAFWLSLPRIPRHAHSE